VDQGGPLDIIRHPLIHLAHQQDHQDRIHEFRTTFNASKPHRSDIHSNYALAKMSVAKSPLCRLLLVLGSLVLLFLPTHAQSWRSVDLGSGWGKPVSVDALLLVDTPTDCI
jgi:hypothetical protein